MPVNQDNILAFQGARKDRKVGNRKPRPALHPSVRRRRLLWLAVMAIVSIYTLYGWITQQNRIWEKEQQLAAKKQQLASMQETNRLLQEEIRRLKTDENYLLELAHSMGYGKPGEEIYTIRE
ncbi:FtsB family cell division protein [Staphylospora marina]|uniref:FtsB family cell division protein n=1 Tax=Staphylospora marina TaxID=2490858 RepID=UPI0013DDB65F|nr:septum formation initiator family protein [Staphylospora marina]